jgi:hypothetical protein
VRHHIKGDSCLFSAPGTGVLDNKHVPNAIGVKQPTDDDDIRPENTGADAAPPGDDDHTQDHEDNGNNNDQERLDQEMDKRYEARFGTCSLLPQKSLLPGICSGYSYFHVVADEIQ